MPKVTIAGARVSCGYSQERLAYKMGVSRETVAAWENGKRRMRTPYIKLFCQVTGFDENDIILPSNNAKRDILSVGNTISEEP